MMKALLTILFTASSLAADKDNASQRIDRIISEATTKRWDATTKADREYRAAVATTFRFADRVEVFLIDFSIREDAAYSPKEGDEVFAIRPYNKETKILKKLKTPPKDIQRWCAAVTKLLTSDKIAGGALCHYPIHGIRIYAGDSLLFETSICWGCSNYYFSYEGQATWESLTEDAKDLRALFGDFMPIPEAEKARFPGAKPKDK